MRKLDALMPDWRQQIQEAVPHLQLSSPWIASQLLNTVEGLLLAAEAISQDEYYYEHGAYARGDITDQSYEELGLLRAWRRAING